MKTLFLLTDTYTTKTVLLCSSLLFSKDVGKVVILGENCVVGETHKSIGKVQVLVIHGIDECIKNSDIVIVDSTSIPSETQRHVKLKAKEFNRQLFLCNLSDNEFTEMTMISNKYKNIPIVMIISIGSFSQTSYIELLLTKILADINVTFDIELSRNTAALLKAISGTGCINTLISQNLLNHSTYANKQLYIHCIKIRDVGELNDMADIIKKISPDFIVVSSDEDLVNLDHLRLVIRYACLSDLDIVIKSHYHTAFSSYTVYCNQPIQSENGVVDIEADDLYTTLCQCLLEKLSYPWGMKPM